MIDQIHIKPSKKFIKWVQINGRMIKKTIWWPHWYQITYFECPPCGRTTAYRERKYTTKPLKQEERVFTEYHWCGCGY